jgi:hypothetical protein
MSRSAAHDARNEILRKAFVDPAVAFANSIPTATTIEKVCKADGLAWKVEDVPNSSGARVHWVGEREAEKAVLWFHGERHPDLEEMLLDESRSGSVGTVEGF